MSLKSNFKRRIPLSNGILFVIAIGLLLFSSIGGASAALMYGGEQNAYVTEIGMMSASVVLVENNHAVTDHALLSSLGEDDGTVIVGKTYDEELFVVNSGNAANGDIDEYIRVQIYKYWRDADGKKVPALDSSLIELSLITGSGWIEDTAASTDERTVLYYVNPVAAGEATSLFCDGITVKDDVLTAVSQNSVTDANGLTTVTTTFLYDGMQVCLEVEADGVQTHHAEDAILSAWGRSVSVTDGGPLSLSGT